MKRLIAVFIFLSFVLPSSVMADTYSSLWKQVESMMEKDLPASSRSILSKIIDKASAEKQYGHLLKAEIASLSLQALIAPDSLPASVGKLEAKNAKAAIDDPVLSAVYCSVLGRLYRDNPSLGEDYKARSDEYYANSLENPQLLARQKSSGYEPMVVNGADSRIFNNDLLHVLGMEAGNIELLHSHYQAAGNRPATCLLALQIAKQRRITPTGTRSQAQYLHTLDSLITCYGDLKECGEVAIERYQVMTEKDNFTSKEKVEYIDKALQRWPAWKRLNVLRNARTGLTCPMFSINIGQNLSLPNTPRKVYINSIRNISTLTVNVYKLSQDGNTRLNPSQKDDYEQLKKGAVLVTDAAQVRHYAGLPTYTELSDTLTIKGLPSGVYMIECLTDNKNIAAERVLMRVSDVLVLTEMLPDNMVRMVVVSATTGKPLPKANVQISTDAYRKNQTKVQTLTCGLDGEIKWQMQGRRPDLIYAYTDTDKAAPETHFGANYSYYDSQRDYSVVKIFTDRKIYRPSQTVHAGVLAYENQQHVNAEVMAGQQLTLVLRDANNKVIEEQKVVIDQYGTASADFHLPSSGLTGQYSVRCENGGSAYFSVEEYKRPTFQVDIDKPSFSYQAGDTIVVTGRAKSFAGVPVQGAKVSYNVVRSTAWWWYRYGNNGSYTLGNDTTTTDADGIFKIKVPLVMAEERDEHVRRYYNFTVSADVTDVAGESQHGETVIPLSSHPTAFDCNLPEKSVRDSLKTITFTYLNNAGEPVEANVRYSIDNGSVLQEVPANTAVPFETSAMTSGKHKLLAYCGNDTLSREFVVFTMNDKRPVVETHDWFYQSGGVFPRDGSPVYIQLGATDDDLHVYYTVVSGRKVIEDSVICMSNAIDTREFRYKEEYGEGLLLNYVWVKNGKIYSHQASITKPLPDKRILTKWKTFRDRLKPGQKEEWILSLTYPDGTPVKGQVMSTLYDKSLDKIRKQDWNIDLALYRNMPATRWNGTSSYAVGLYGYMNYKALTEPVLCFSHFDNELFPALMYNNFYQYDRPLEFGGKRLARAEAVSVTASSNVELNVMDEMAVSTAEEGVADDGVKATKQRSSDSGETPNSGSTGQIRENLNETAFFYPALVSDAKGNVAIRFTLPESVTTWRFIGLAHDKNMCYGMLTDEAVAKKEVMVQPNIPRFVRENDEATIIARLINTTENTVSGVARMELIDPETDKVLYTVKKPYTIKASETGGLSFNWKVSTKLPLVICRIIAEGKGYSDGEQHYLPVMPSKELVTNTLALILDDSTSETIDLETLFPVKDDKNKLTIEYTDNPSWLMIQALPSIGNVDEENAISLAAALYANSIASNIMHQSPDIKRVVELWTREQTAEPSLMSNLEKSQDLKSMALNETPWLFDAVKETDQKRRLIDFFNVSAVENRLNDCYSKLQMLQNADGSFSWWRGMHGSLYITTAVGKMLVRLNQMIGNQKNATQMLSGIFKYLGNELVKEAEELKKQEREGLKDIRPDETLINVLYMCSLDGRTLPDNVRAAKAYLVKLMSQQTAAYTIYGKAVAAIVLARNGYATKAKEYLQSIREYTVYKDGMGRYFDTPKAYSSWFDYKIPTEVAAIEALKLLEPDDKQTVKEMKYWLLQSKRTQCWDTPINSVDAVYAFLNGETKQELTTESTNVVIKVNGKPIDLPRATAGVGYIKTAITGDRMSKMTLERNNNHVSWGAVYAQFMQEVSDVASTETGLKVVRELRPSHTPVQVGDRVTVRITITADRDYDFVQLSDRRAACLEPVNQLSGYHNGYYCSPKDNVTNYYFSRLSKGSHIIETEYFIDREGVYHTGTCVVQCAYSPEFMGRDRAKTIEIK